MSSIFPEGAGFISPCTHTYTHMHTTGACTPSLGHMWTLIPGPKLILSSPKCGHSDPTPPHPPAHIQSRHLSCHTNYALRPTNAPGVHVPWYLHTPDSDARVPLVNHQMYSCSHTLRHVSRHSTDTEVRIRLC